VTGFVNLDLSSLLPFDFAKRNDDSVRLRLVDGTVIWFCDS